MIRKNCAVEAEAKNVDLDGDGRLPLRKKKSVPVLDDFCAWVLKMKSSLGKTSKLAEAVRYFATRSTHACPANAALPTGVSRSTTVTSSAPSRSPASAEKLPRLRLGSGRRTPAAYTLAMSCNALGIDVHEYFVDLISKLAAGSKPSRIREFVPDAWAAARIEGVSADPSGH